MKGAFVPNKDSTPQAWEVLDLNGTVQAIVPSKFAAKEWIRNKGEGSNEYDIRRVR